jgi:GNAT superfamily N-acetyltransferase
MGVSESFECVPAAGHSDEAMAAIFTRGYAGYFVPITLNAVAFRSHVALNDIDLEASRVGVVGGEPVAFALLGVRDAAGSGGRGWIGGMGVAPEARGRGLGRAIMDAVVAEAQRRELAAVDLEVLEQNVPAARIYEAMGFVDTRPLDVWTREVVPLPSAGPGEIATESIAVADALAAHRAFHPERLPWQCDLPMLEHAAPVVAARAVRDAGGLVAYALFRADGKTLRVADLGGRPGSGPQPLEALLRALIAAHPDAALTVLNVPADTLASEALRRVGAVAKLRQREMRLTLEARPEQ